MTTKTFPAIAALTATTALLLSACGQSPDNEADAGPEGDRVAVLASFYPLQYVASVVGGDSVDVTSLTPPGAEPHDLELSPRQVREVGDADLVLYLSGFQPAVDEALAARAPQHSLDAADAVDLVAGHGDERDHEGESEAEAEAHDHEGHDHEAEPHEGEAHEDEAHEDEAHDHGATDPHFWLDPTLLAQLALPVAQTLSEIDPDGAEGYTARAQQLVQDLTALDEEMLAGLQTCERDVIVTSHEAFGYLVARYGLEQVGISGVDPEAEPSPARLREVGQIATDEGVTTIFFETLVSPKVAEVLAESLGLEAAVLEPLEGLTDSSSDYRGVMQQNLVALRSALGCA